VAERLCGPALRAPAAVPSPIQRRALMLAVSASARAEPVRAVVDSQSSQGAFAPSAAATMRQADQGRKRHIAVDTDGVLLMVNLTTADISDSAVRTRDRVSDPARWPGSSICSRRSLRSYQAARCGRSARLHVEIIRRSDDRFRFQGVPRRWVVERTFGWMTRWRRLVRDYEKRLDVSGAMIHLAMAASKPGISRGWYVSPGPSRAPSRCRSRPRSGR